MANIMTIEHVDGSDIGVIPRCIKCRRFIKCPQEHEWYKTGEAYPAYKLKGFECPRCGPFHPELVEARKKKTAANK